jgi:predicted RNase H-like nuclease (RuvC/YqgF family)
MNDAAEKTKPIDSCGVAIRHLERENRDAVAAIRTVLDRNASLLARVKELERGNEVLRHELAQTRRELTKWIHTTSEIIDATNRSPKSP